MILKSVYLRYFWGAQSECEDWWLWDLGIVNGIWEYCSWWSSLCFGKWIEFVGDRKWSIFRSFSITHGSALMNHRVVLPFGIQISNYEHTLWDKRSYCAEIARKNRRRARSGRDMRRISLDQRWITHRSPPKNGGSRIFSNFRKIREKRLGVFTCSKWSEILVGNG